MRTHNTNAIHELLTVTFSETVSGAELIASPGPTEVTLPPLPNLLWTGTPLPPCAIMPGAPLPLLIPRPLCATGDRFWT